MDGITPVAAQIRGPDLQQGLNNYASMLGIQQQRQQLQTGAYNQQVAAAQAAQQEQQVREMRSGAQLLADPVSNGLLDEDGNPTRDSYSIIQRHMPMTGASHFKDLMEAAHSKVTFNKAASELTDEQRGIVSRRIAGVLGNPRASSTDVVAELDGLESDYAGSPNEGAIAKMTAAMRHDILKMAKDNPAGPDGSMAPRVREVLGNKVRGSLTQGELSGPSGVNTPRPGMVDQGGIIQPTVTTPVTGETKPQGMGFGKSLGPGQQILTDGNGRQFVYDQQRGTVTPVGAGGGGGGGGAPAAPGKGGIRFSQPVPNQKEVVDQIEGARKAGDSYGLNAHVNDRLIDLVKNKSTGPGSETFNAVTGAFGIVNEGASDEASQYQLINAYLDRQAAANADAMGVPHTNAGLETSKSLSGNIGYNQEALLEKIRLTSALNEASNKFRRGLDRAVGLGENPDYGAYQRFRSAWASNYDPRIFQLDDAHRRNDQQAVSQIIKSLKPGESAQLKAKTIALRALEKGQIPDER
jgi:hypothetical protein